MNTMRPTRTRTRTRKKRPSKKRTKKKTSQRGGLPSFFKRNKKTGYSTKTDLHDGTFKKKRFFFSEHGMEGIRKLINDKAGGVHLLNQLFTILGKDIITIESNNLLKGATQTNMLYDTEITLTDEDKGFFNELAAKFKLDPNNKNVVSKDGLFLEKVYKLLNDRFNDQAYANEIVGRLKVRLNKKANTGVNNNDQANTDNNDDNDNANVNTNEQANNDNNDNDNNADVNNNNGPEDNQSIEAPAPNEQ